MPASATASHPIRQFVLKVHGRCDLACDHCYVYEHADQSWRGKPAAMSAEVLHTAAVRIAEHATEWHLPMVRVVIHGGEPLLHPPAVLDAMLSGLHAVIGPVTRLDLRMQSNGVRLDEAYCAVLMRHGVKVGISLDGGRTANDLHRRFAHGASSHDGVLRALELLRRPEFREAYAGILCTIDIRNDPIRVYEDLVAQQPPQIDFLLPHSTWDRPPRPSPDDATPYATWLSTVHKRWLADGRPMRIRMFDGLLSAAYGGPTGSEQFGTDPVDLAVVDTDGSWEQADSLKTAYDGAPATGLTVFAHAVDELSRQPAVAVRLAGIAGLSATCQACPLVRQCGGGLYAHRYRFGTGFDNPSVYCADIKEFVAAMNRSSPMPPTARRPRSLPAGLIEQIGSGYGDAGALRYLATTQHQITRRLVTMVGESDGGHGPAREAYALLKKLDSVAPDAVAQVLAHPYLRRWAVGCLRAGAVERTRESAYLGAVAAAAAVAAREPARLTVPVRNGRIYLPTLGTVVFADGSAGAAEIEIEIDGFTVRSPDATVAVSTRTAEESAAEENAAWQPTRTLAAGEHQLRLEDGDPYRDCHDYSPAGRLSDEEALRWRRAVAEAWEIIGIEAPQYLPGLVHGLRMIVPVQPAADGSNRASTARHAYGSLAAAIADPATLAEMIVHEFQHGKLGGLLDLCQLLEPGVPERIKVAWRPDPRPVEGVLQGIYAFLAVTDIWRVRAQGPGPGQAEAIAKYERYREWTLDAIGQLRRSSALRPDGDRFVDAAAATIAGWTA